MIKAQQLPQEQVETFLKENKAFKTTVLVVGAVGLCLLPAMFYLVMFAVGFFPGENFSFKFNADHDTHFHDD